MMLKKIFLIVMLSVVNVSSCKTLDNVKYKKNMENKIYSKTLTEGFKIDVYCEKLEFDYSWEISLTKDKSKSNKKFNIKKEDLINSHILGNRSNFHEYLKIIDVFYVKGEEFLYIIIDKFGQVDLHKYKLNDFSFSETEKVVVLNIKKYQIIPRDVDLLGEDIQDIKLFNQNICLISKSLYRKFDTYFFNIYDFDKDLRREFDVSMSQIKEKLIVVENDILSIKEIDLSNFNNINSILEAVKQKSIYKKNRLTYYFYLETRKSKENFINKKNHFGDVFFFVKIDNDEKIIINDSNGRWYITEYSINYPKLKDFSTSIKDINSIINYL